MKRILFLLLLTTAFRSAWAHPMPGSLVNLSVLEGFIRGEARVPFTELQNAVGDARTANLQSDFLQQYFTQHIVAETDGVAWHTQIDGIDTQEGQDAIVGNYREVRVRFTLTPPDPSVLRRFRFHYDAVLHQVVTHSALVLVAQDWRNGIHDEGVAQQVGVIRMDIPTGTIAPLDVQLSAGSWWRGFGGMFRLGVAHIRAGTDHLLFLFVLLLPAMLRPVGGRWGAYGGLRYGLLHLLRIVTAFTIGHSLTLLLGALGWLRLPEKAVEILIAVSILISAVHAFRALFPGREALVAGGFGLVHGLAFASVLTALQLNAGPLALSILGFNLGIEAAQLAMIAVAFPVLVLLSRTRWYGWIRPAGAILSAVAALVWIVERSV